MIHLLTGGARSGKSRLALTLAEAVEGPIDFIATAQAGDEDMAARIRQHQAERGPRYRSTEAPVELTASVLSLRPGGAIVVDCLTLWCANLIFAGLDDAEIGDRSAQLIEALRESARPTFVVTNEVGLGIVPADALSRRYRDLLGRMNQRFAATADRVTFLVAGLPVTLR
ncbi:adenosylcobinamide kinase/adenosylcobinamide phosphate guanyltransferase [Deltaproteobacteria bacterium]|nr:adenosylcobinamide kinase/adenosylcobinamide phosphate guanyltransferase [Deltaproteobacteria bacterium]